ncbi:elongation factor P maturation arginine rhamnosyltransferase EarP [Fusobacterium mortiferum]|uniref:Protein-arginine rhamnosyltransferase n=1 Tax=Fusobacterium mortiferum TaxID=850 RepID=A0ABS2G0L9_FUSMR|nr:elongation factor P maturation arginine rhamnosyltransferase EarP [Fusobacterium mortiferum]MBM6874330.1 elongation factor P maturation arginine rhamnosyltransferase EarP [Fusobacterium mortiferum]
MELKTLDIFCEIIDNYGDIGVVYRTAKELQKIFPKSKIRVFLNRLDEFKKINSQVLDLPSQNIDGIEYITFDYLRDNANELLTAQVIIEAFGCQIPEKYMEIAYDNSELLINLEYLSAEDWIEDFHLQSSPLGRGKLKKVFFMPGFTEKSGGVIADSNYLERIQRLLENKEFYEKKYFSDIENRENKIVGTLFSYEKNFTPLLEDLKKLDKNVVILAMGEKTQDSLRKILKNFSIEDFRNSLKYGKIEIRFLNFLNQEEYEELINIVDFNFVRGEDSFIRAVLTGKPYMWHIYCQEEYAHMDKIEGFLDKYRRVIENFSDEDFLLNMEKFFKDYNFRKENSLELGKESYLYFFENLAKIEKYNTIFRDFLIQKCNLINKLKDFIEKY